MKNRLGNYKKDEVPDDPYVALAQKVYIRAVVDRVTLRYSGAVKGGKALNPWPLYLGKPLVVLDDYNKTYQAQELLDFFNKGWDKRFLEACDLVVDAKTIIDALEEEGFSAVGLTTGDTK